jgi:copper(I)-binding protein
VNRAGWPPTTFLLLGLAACGTGKASGATTRIDDLEITRAFAYEPITAASGAAYFRIDNTGTLADTLVEAVSPAARGATFHGGSMAHLNALPLPPGGHVVLEPGGTHLMLTDFTALPHAGDSLTVTLRFARAGSVTLKLPVRRYGE